MNISEATQGVHKGTERNAKTGMKDSQRKHGSQQTEMTPFKAEVGV